MALFNFNSDSEKTKDLKVKMYRSNVCGHPDKPIEKNDNDLFVVDMYVDGLCEFVCNCSTPMTISIQGDWGSGKTSMMKMMEERIKKYAHPVWFNTWQYSQFNMQEELPISMMCNMLTSLGCDENSLKTVVNIGKSLMKGLFRFGASTVGAQDAADEAIKCLEGDVTNYAKQIEKLKDEFQEAINRKAAETRADRVVVFVDDLDRLQPSKAVELLEVLKVFLDCEKCVYILAVDYGVVTQGIKQKFGNLVGEEKGRSFFDKIIQLPFKMPVAQYNVNNYVEKSLAAMGINFKKNEEEKFKRYVDLIRISIGFNPRSMKRLFNTYQLLNIILQKKADSNIMNSNELLFAIICMQMEFEKLYEYLVKNPLVVRDFVERKITQDVKEDIGIVDETEMSRIVMFMGKFNEALQLDEKLDEVSDAEIMNLQKVLSFSAVTSVSASGSLETDNDKDWEFRYKNIKVIEKTNSLLKEKCGCEFSSLQYKKNKDDRKISDGVGYVTFNDLEFNYTFRYAIRTDYTTLDTVLDISIYPNGPKKAREWFSKHFEVSILKDLEGDWDEEWCYWHYANLHKYPSLTCQNPESELANIVSKAFNEFREVMEAKKSQMQI